MTTMSRRMIAMALIVTAAAASACSSSSSGGGAGGSGTLKIGMIADVGTAVDLSLEEAAAKGAIRRINAAGGIAGRHVQLDFCNEGLDPNKARACARTMISDHVFAMAGSQPLAAEQDVDNALKRASIANVGPSSYGPSDKDSNSYLLFGGQNYVNAAQIVFATKDQGPKMSLSLLDSPLTSAFVPFYKKALPTVGGRLTATVTSPQQATDLSPQAAQLTNSHPDWVNTNSAPAAVIGVVNGMVELGYRGKVMVSGTELTEAQIKTLGPNAGRLLFVSPFPPVTATSFAGIRQFRLDMAAEAKSGDKSAPTSTTYVPFLALDSYFSVVAIAQIANSAKAIDAKAFKTAIDAAKAVDLGGVIPPWTPNASISTGVPRASDGSFYYLRWTNSAAVLVDPKPVDVTSVVDAGLGH